MSLIEEALRRVQDPLIPKQSSGSLPAPAPKQKPAVQERPVVHSWTTQPSSAPLGIPPTHSSRNPLIVVALAVFALTVMFIIGGAFWMGRTIARTEPRIEAKAVPIQPPLPPPPPEPAVLPQVQVAKEAAPAIPQMERPAPVSHQEEFVLSGVVEGMGESYAVINGTIIGVGEQIGDATLQEIAKGSVTLRHEDGKETILRVPR